MKRKLHFYSIQLNVFVLRLLLAIQHTWEGTKILEIRLQTIFWSQVCTCDIDYADRRTCKIVYTIDFIVTKKFERNSLKTNYARSLKLNWIFFPFIGMISFCVLFLFYSRKNDRPAQLMPTIFPYVNMRYCWFVCLFCCIKCRSHWDYELSGVSFIKLTD